MTDNAAATYEDDATYAVKLKRIVNFLGATLLPLPVHEMSGRALKSIILEEGADVVDRAERI